jgi:hypothetical protein
VKKFAAISSASYSALAAAVMTICALPLPIHAEDSPPAVMQAPMRDPWIPPAARKPSTSPPAQGAALRRQVEQKLKKAFDQADVGHSGTVSLEQAQAANLGFVVRHFDDIDVNKTGVVQFDDVKQFLKKRGAQLD